MIDTPFGDILRRAVHATPGAVGGALAASDGEIVDAWCAWDETEWRLLTAHFGVVVNHIRSALHTFHFGDVQFIFLSYDELDILIQVLEDNYYALLAIEPPIHLGAAAQNLERAAQRLQQEMF